MTLWIAFRNRLRLLVVVLLLSGFCLPAWSDPIKPSPQDRHITLAVSSLVRTEHLSKHPLDDEISQRCLKTFLKNLDPMKVYFYQSDVDRFMAQQNDLDDLAKKGDVSFAYTVFQTYLARIDEKLAMAEECLATKPDFTVDEEILKDGDLTAYARNEAEAREKWRKRVKYDLLLLKAGEKKLEGQEAVEKLGQKYRSLARRMHQTDDEELLEMYLSAMTTGFDPHTSYMSASTLENFEIAMRLQLEGIGAALQAVDGYTVVKKIIPGGAAEKDGRLKVEDKIAGVGEGVEGEIVDAVDMKLSEVVKMIRGKRGTVVRLEVISPDSPERKTIEITRAKIELKDSEARYKIFEEGRKSDGQPYKLGVIDLPSFYMDMAGARKGLPDFKSTTRDVRKILETFNEQGVDAVILDLRRNGGGSLQEAINLTGLFITEGPIVQVKDSDDLVQGYRDLDSGIVWKGPLVVLTSKLSASASEILAGAIQDYHRGLIVGDHATHGKGTVQSLMDLGARLIPFNPPRLGALKITMQQFYRPNGDSTQNRGVLADVELPSLTTHMDIGEADLDYPIAFDQVDPLEFDKLTYVDKVVRDRLRDLSSQRIGASEDFQKVRQNITRYEEQKDRKVVTLNEAKFMAEIEALNADKEEEKLIEDMNDAADNGIERTFYLDEAMAITLDYLQLVFLARAN